MNNYKKFYTFLLILNLFTSNYIIIKATAIRLQKNEELEWIIQPGSILEYEVTIESNSTLETVIDEIALEYNFSELIENLKGNKAFEVKALNSTNINNITQICKDILNFTGPCQMEKKWNETWDPVERYMLPFFIPIDHWSEIETQFVNLLPDSSIIDYKRSLLYDYTFNLIWTDDNNNQLYEFWYQWKGDNGVLNAMGLKISDDFEIDSFTISLSSLYIPDIPVSDDYRGIWIPGLIFIFCLVSGTFIKYIKAEKEGTLYKIKKKRSDNS